MTDRNPETVSSIVQALAQRAADSIRQLRLKRPDLDCPSCGAAMVWRQVTDFKCQGCQATWTYVRGNPGPTMQERRRIQATGLPAWWLAPDSQPDDPQGGPHDPAEATE